jgi:hypothetical protein
MRASRRLLALAVIAIGAAAAMSELHVSIRAGHHHHRRPGCNVEEARTECRSFGASRNGHGHDPVSHRVVLFGGYDDLFYLNETWSFDGTTWRMETPSLSPSPRAAAGLAYDAVSQRLVLFGGYDGAGYLGDTWVWDGATSSWEKRIPRRSPHPPSRGP